VSGLASIQRLYVPSTLALEVHAHLAYTGDLGLEGFALWAGVAQEDTFLVQHAIIPAQHGLRSADGLCVTVDGAELHRINVWLFEHYLTLIAQLHSHPTEAYHSPTDDAFCVVTAVGCLSIVVPDFASQPFDLARCAVYRLTKHGWLNLTSAEASKLIRMID